MVKFNGKRKEKELFKDTKMNEKPNFKDLVSIMFKQYLVILPIVFGFILVFMLLTKLLLLLWK